MPKLLRFQRRRHPSKLSLVKSSSLARGRLLQHRKQSVATASAAATMQLPSSIPAVAKSFDLRRGLLRLYPWVVAPFIISAPMRILTGPELAVAVSSAGGLGFIGPPAVPTDMYTDLEKAEQLFGESSFYSPSADSLLPVGVGFQTWNGNVTIAAEIVNKHKPCAAWLFAPREGQSEFDKWTAALRAASPGTQIWQQVGTLNEALAAANSPNETVPDVLVIQGAEAGGHGRANDGMGTMALFPEVSDALASYNIPIVAAGGLVDGRGIAAALSLGAAGTVLGTRFLASEEARIAKGYQDEVVRASNGAVSTVRTHLYNHLRGTFNWPEHWAPRGIINRSWTDYLAGVPFEELQKRYDEALTKGDAGWGPEGRMATYASGAVGLVRSVDKAADIVQTLRHDAKSILKAIVVSFCHVEEDES